MCYCLTTYCETSCEAMAERDNNSFKIPKKVKPKVDVKEVLAEEENEFEEFTAEEWVITSNETDCWDDVWEQSSDSIKDTDFDQKLKDICLKVSNDLKQNEENK